MTSSDPDGGTAPDDAARPCPLVVVMGVSAVGKSTVGEKLAARLGLEYADADSFHSQANIDKMSSGTALVDDDRWPWLASIGSWLSEKEPAGAVVSCSALARRYRDVLVATAPAVTFLHLDGHPEVIKERVAHRPHHFMPASLLDSQLDTLEPLEDDEPGIAFDLTRPPDDIVEAFLTWLARR